MSPDQVWIQEVQKCFRSITWQTFDRNHYKNLVNLLAWCVCTPNSKVFQFCRILFMSGLLDGSFSKYISVKFFSRKMFDKRIFTEEAILLVTLFLSEWKKKKKNIKRWKWLPILQSTDLKAESMLWIDTKGSKYWHIKTPVAIAKSLQTWYARFMIVCLF